jgi:16S rRNA U516 pseudouridylate synthase RsuA-like enzyme
VARLKRVAIGPLTARGLRLGEWRELTEQELTVLRERTSRHSPRQDTNAP